MNWGSGAVHGSCLWLLIFPSLVGFSPSSRAICTWAWESRWRLQWSSASPKYGGQGTPPVRPHSHLHIPGESAVLLRSERGPIEDAGEEIEPGKTHDGHGDA